MYKWLKEGGVTAAKGYRACGVAAGLKAGRNDMAMLVSDCDAVAAGVFTTNRVAAAPVVIDKAKLAANGGKARAIVVNAGCANACTGQGGHEDALRECEFAAGLLGVDAADVLVSSTGVIGRRLPMDRIEGGIRLAVEALSYDGGNDAAKAIMTTDTVDKQVGLTLDVEGTPVTIGGMCKGAGMISPRLATMLCYITTDASVDAADLQAALRHGVSRSFNRIIVDGDESTNDTVLILANGMSGAGRISRSHRAWGEFQEAVDAVCLALAQKIVKDGEGATKFITVEVTGAASESDAYAAARAIAVSPLVKTACFGGDPNWGRIICAAGYSGAEIDETRARIRFDDAVVYDRGTIADESGNEHLAEIMKRRDFVISIDLGAGDCSDCIYTTDFSYEYVKINGEYTT